MKYGTISSALLCVSLLLSIQVQAQNLSGPQLAKAAGWDFKRHSCIFKKDVIAFGASVTNGFMADGPATVLANANPKLKKNFAIAGGKGQPEWSSDVAALISLYPNVGTIISVDAFYYAPTEENSDRCKWMLKEIDFMGDLAENRGINIVLANNPFELGEKACKRLINRKLQEWNKRPNCYLLDEDRIWKEFQAGRSETFGAKVASRDNVLSDGLHLSNFGATILAEEILRTMDQDAPVCD